MTTAPMTRNDMAAHGIFTAGALSLGALSRATLSAKTAALPSYCCHALASTLSLTIIRGLATRCGRPITDREITVLGATSLGLSAALYLSGASGAVLTLAVANACEGHLYANDSNSPQTAALGSAVRCAQLIGLANYTSFIPSALGFFAKVSLVDRVTLLAHQAMERYAGGEIDRQLLTPLQLIMTTKLVAFYFFGYISMGTLAAGSVGMYSYISTLSNEQNQ